jgi:DNA adenine methylase
MTLEQHTHLLLLIQKLKGMVLISGYDHPLYNSLLSSWWRVEFDVPNNAACGPAKGRKCEIVWCNFKPQSAAAKEVASR